jgi:hypothetical protein
MTFEDGFENQREACGEDCRMQVVRPGRIECHMCDGNPRIKRLEEELARYQAAYPLLPPAIQRSPLVRCQEYKVVINGQHMVVSSPGSLAYEDIVLLSDEDWGSPSVTYRHANQQKSEGTTWPGGPDVRIKDGTIFNVSHTGNA